MDQFRISGHDFNEIAPAPEQTPSSSAPPPHTKIDWLRTHPYASAFAVACSIMLIGALVVSTRSAVDPSGGGGAWGGANVNLLNPAYSGGSGMQDPGMTVPMQPSVPYTYIPPATIVAAAPDSTGEVLDFNAFLAELSGTSSRAPETDAETSVEAAFSFIPSGFISTTTPVKKRSKAQQELYEYGNEAGSYIQSFEDSHRDQSQVLKHWLEDRHDETKRAAVVQLSRALWETGRSLLLLQPVPETASALNKALAESYMEIGANLALVPKAESDTDFLAAINVYNASADTFGKQYVALVNLFGAYGVSFTADDPGSAFTFKPISL